MNLELIIFGGAGLIILVAFTALILVPAIGSFARTWEKATAAVLSLIVLTALVGLGIAAGIAIVYNWDNISSLFS